MSLKIRVSHGIFLVNSKSCRRDVEQPTPNEVLSCLNSSSLQTNTYQAVLVTDGLLSFVILNYDKLMWTSANSASGNGNAQGLGGHAAQVKTILTRITAAR